MKPNLTTPVALIIFRRPDTTQRVFDAIRQARPKQLFVIADGPRTSEEAPRCEAARAIINTVDWDCEVHKNYSDFNLGLKRRVSSGIDWVFTQVEEVIVLEDDCLPDTTFFRFCSELLDYYCDEPRVMHISGNNFLRGRVPIETSYYFSRYPHYWGWATWRSAWTHNDVELSLWNQTSDKKRYLEQFQDRYERRFWRYTWDQRVSGKSDSWAAQWIFACLNQGGLSVTPDKNLVSNIGAGAKATHTRRQRLTHFMETPSMDFPLRHPSTLTRNESADRIAVYDALLNSPSGSPWLDAVRWLAKNFVWQFR